MDQAELVGDSGCNIGTLPCISLGLPLSYRKPRKVECHKFIDKISSKLKPWKGKLMSRKGRLVTMFDPPIWMTKKIDKIRRSFLWCGDDNFSGAKCM
jgi:hypothetical protein